MKTCETKRPYQRQVIGRDVRAYRVTPAQQLAAIRWVVTGEKNQTEVGKLLGVSPQLVSYWCKGRKKRIGNMLARPGTYSIRSA
jgi:hypothetical protein